MNQMVVTIIEDIAEFFFDYAGAGAKVATLVVVVYLCGLWLWCRRRHEDVPGTAQVVIRAVLLFLLALYLYIVLGITVLSRSESETRHAYFELFRTFQDTFVARKQIYENVLLFVPYAILLFGLAEFFRNGWLMMGIGLISSFAIEATQWITHAGYFEIDDIWTNVVGMMLGYVLCVIVRLVIRSCRR